MRKPRLGLPILIGAILLLALPCLGTAQGPIPIGNDFQVNTYTTGDQYFPSVATTPKGGFLIAWQSKYSGGTDIDDSSIQAQRFDAAGLATGSQFQVNTYTTGEQSWASAAADEFGNFIIVWLSLGSYGTDSDGSSVQGQVIASSGSRLSGQFQVNSYTTGFQRLADVAAQPGGSFVVIWSGLGYGSDPNEGVQGQRIQLDGTPIGGEFQVNSYTIGRQWWPQIAADGAGNFVATWTSAGSGGTDTRSESIQGRRFQADASPLGNDFQVNSITGLSQSIPSIAPRPDGEFVVAWSSWGSNGSDEDRTSIQARLFQLSWIFIDDFESGDTSAWSSSVP